MNHIDICTGTSYGARSATIAVINSMGGPDCVKAVRLNTQLGGPDLESPSEEWALILECESRMEGLSNVEIRVCMLTSGYPGTGPHDLVEVLKSAGFKVNEHSIFNKCPLKGRWIKK